MTHKCSFKDVLVELVEAIEGTDAAREIDAGCEGEGPFATALVAVGKYKTLKKATKSIYGDWE